MKFNIVLCFVLLFCMVIFSCSSPLSNPVADSSSASLTIIMDNALSRSIVPDEEMQAVNYQISGNGPGNSSFLETSIGSLTVTNLAAGEWNITVTAINSMGTNIGTGSTTVVLINNSSVSAEIDILPFDGFGNLDLTVNWLESDVNSPQIDCELIPTQGTSRSLDFTINGNQASYSGTNIPTGYYTLIIKLFDHGYLAKAAVEIVWIAKDITSTGSFTFDQIDLIQGKINVNVVTDLTTPLDVHIMGEENSKPDNLSMQLRASVSNYSDNVTYIWYVNGVAQDIGETFVFDDSWAQGKYRIDVTACSADNQRGGSSGFTIDVESAIGPFRTRWLTGAWGDIHIPLNINGFYDFTIDWGDGTTEHITNVYSNGSISYIGHNYGGTGGDMYDISISGTCDGFGYTFVDRSRYSGIILSILEWGGVKLHNEGYQFYECTSLEVPNDLFISNSIDLSYLTNMSSMFMGCELFNADLSAWDISTVTDMSSMFSGCREFSSDLSSWDTASVTDMSSMFSGCWEFTSDLSSWNTSSVTDMSYMFSTCTFFNSDLSSWDTSSAVNMKSMFNYCSSFNGSISTWDTSSVYTMSQMFRYALVFNKDISSWDTSSVLSMENMFYGAQAFNCGNIDINSWNWNVSEVLSAPSMFIGSLLAGNEPAWYNEL